MDGLEPSSGARARTSTASWCMATHFDSGKTRRPDRSVDDRQASERAVASCSHALGELLRTPLETSAETSPTERVTRQRRAPAPPTSLPGLLDGVEAHRALGAAAAPEARLGRVCELACSCKARMRPWRRRSRLRSCACRPRAAVDVGALRDCRGARAPSSPRRRWSARSTRRSIDAPPMLVDLDEVVRLRKENAALQADLAVKADLLDTRWTRTTATSRAPTQLRRGQQLMNAGKVAPIKPEPAVRVEWPPGRYIDDEMPDSTPPAPAAAAGGTAEASVAGTSECAASTAPAAGVGRTPTRTPTPAPAPTAPTAPAILALCHWPTAPAGTPPPRLSREVQGALPEAAPEQSCHAAVGLPVLLRRWRAEPVRPAVRHRGLRRRAAGAAGAADSPQRRRRSWRRRAAAGRGCSRVAPAAAAPLSALDREAFAIMY